MVEYLKWNKIAFYILGFIAVVSIVSGVEITKERFTPILTLTDDRATSTINDNFRRATALIIEDKGFNVAIGAASTSTVVRLNFSQPDTNYGLFTGFQSSMTITKSLDKFKVEYAAPGANTTLDWILVR